MKTPAIHAGDFSFAYAGGDTDVLHQLSFALAEGEFVFLTGASGSGKSTLLQELAGIIPAGFRGRVSGHLDVAGDQPVGLVLQNLDAQMFQLSVEEELRFGPENLGLPEEECRRRVDGVSRCLDLESLRTRRSDELSMGQRQLVALASVLTLEPRLLLLDEPTSNLDFRSIRRLYRLLAGLRRERGVTILLADHRSDGIDDYLDRLLLLRDGRLEWNSDGRELRDRAWCRARGIRSARSLRSELLQDRQNAPGGEVCLRARDLCWKRDGRMLIDRLNLELSAGELTVLLGELGSGKTSLARLLVGLARPSSGQVDVGELRAREALARGELGLVLQNPREQFFCDTVGEEATFAARNHGRLDLPWLERVLDGLDLTSLAGRSVQSLSGGQAQRLAIASMLAARPRVLILDEPTSGQDWGHLEDLMALLGVYRRGGGTVLLITHDWRLANHFADRCLFLSAGRLTDRGNYIRRMMDDDTETDFF